MAGQMDVTGAEDLFRDALTKEDRSDYKGAFSSFLAAAKLGSPGSQVNVGDYYAAGRGVARDLSQAARWYRRAYHNGESTAALNLSVDLLKQGKVKGAVKWLRRAVAMNDGEACLSLAKIYLQRPRGLKAAMAFLNEAVLHNSISEDSREEAALLLRRAMRRSNHSE